MGTDMNHLPHINMNGDNAAELYRQNEAVYNAAETLLKALSGAHPHGRNWQTAPGGTISGVSDCPSYTEARRNSAVQRERVEIIMEDAMEVMIHCRDHPSFKRVVDFNRPEVISDGGT